MATNKNTSKKNKMTTGETVGIILLLLLTFGLAAAFIFRKKPVADEQDITVNVNTGTTPKFASNKVSRNDNFPLQRGSLGDRVRQLQKALISKYGASVLPQYGADGDFGTETFTALSSKGIPTSLGESEFNALVGNSITSLNSGSSINYNQDAIRLKNAFDDEAGTDTAMVINYLKTSRSPVYLKALRDTYDRNYGGQGTLVSTLRKEQKRIEFNDIINKLETL